MIKGVPYFTAFSTDVPLVLGKFGSKEAFSEMHECLAQGSVSRPRIIDMAETIKLLTKVESEASTFSSDLQTGICGLGILVAKRWRLGLVDCVKSLPGSLPPYGTTSVA